MVECVEWPTIPGDEDIYLKVYKPLNSGQDCSRRLLLTMRVISSFPRLDYTVIV